MAALICHIVALVLFVLVALGVEVSGVGLLGLGLAFLTLGFILGHSVVAGRLS